MAHTNSKEGCEESGQSTDIAQYIHSGLALNQLQVLGSRDQWEPN